MKKIVKTLIIPIAMVALAGCGNQTTTSSDTTNASSSVVTGSQNLNNVLDYFSKGLNTVATYNYFDSTTKPRATTVFLEDGLFTTYRGFDNLENNGLINISSELGEKKGVAAGVYSWTKESSALSLGEKVGEGTYQSLFSNPQEIAANKEDYIHCLHHESEAEASDKSTENKLDDSAKSALNGNFTLNKIFKDDESKNLLVSFAKSLGVYEILTKSGMELNYAKIYFGPISPVVNVSFYTQKDGGYSEFETSVVCTQFGSAKINELTSYIEAE